jgi:hypothetical protein
MPAGQFAGTLPKWSGCFVQWGASGTHSLKYEPETAIVAMRQRHMDRERP